MILHGPHECVPLPRLGSHEVVKAEQQGQARSDGDLARRIRLRPRAVHVVDDADDRRAVALDVVHALA